MTYKSIVVYVDTSTQSRARTSVAMDLAQRFGANLEAVYAVFTPDPEMFYVMAGSADYYSVHEEERSQRANDARLHFMSELGRYDIRGQWTIAAASEDFPGSRQTRCADLIVTGQTNPDDPETYVSKDFGETLVMYSGRPVLMVPYIGNFRSIGTHAMVAWDGSQESTRAIYDAMPFLRLAQQVSVLTIDETAKRSRPGSATGKDIAATIERHGVRAEIVALSGVDHSGVGEALLSQAADLGADLLVMGAYGHARWREMVLGGATRTVMSSATLPVLLSN